MSGLFSAAFLRQIGWDVDVYERANLRIKPSYTVDGLVAGTWDIEAKRGEAVLTLRPLEKLPKAARAELVD